MKYVICILLLTGTVLCIPLILVLKPLLKALVAINSQVGHRTSVTITLHTQSLIWEQVQTQESQDYHSCEPCNKTLIIDHAY